MEGNTVLHQLMSVRMESNMNGITENDAFYQETKQRTGEYSDKLMPCSFRRKRSCS